MRRQSFELNKKARYSSVQNGHSSFNDLLKDRLITFIIDTKPDLTATDHENLSNLVAQATSSFAVFVENSIIFEELQRYIIQAIEQGFSFKYFKEFLKTHESLELCKLLSEVIRNFYLVEVLSYAWNPYSTSTFNHRELQSFIVDLGKAMFNRRLPAKKISDSCDPLNQAKIFDILNSISNEIIDYLVPKLCEYIPAVISNDRCIETHSFIDAVALNAIWIVNEIECRFNSDITGLNVDLLQQQIQTFDNAGYKTFISIYNLFIRGKSERKFETTEGLFELCEYEDANDLLLLLIVTRSDRLGSLFMDKRNIFRAINTPLFLHSILYVSLGLVDDDSIYAQMFLQMFSFQHMSFNEYLPSADIMLSLFEIDDQPQQKKRFAKIALDFMVQFILRATDYRVVYELDTTFYEKCKDDCKRLTLITPQLIDTVADQSISDSTSSGSVATTVNVLQYSSKFRY